MIERNIRMENPENYTPLVSSLFKEGMEFGSHKFVVGTKSHDKTISFLEKSYSSRLNLDHPLLLPSEMWGWARVLSQRFGRLNEVMATKVNWKIYGYGKPNEQLTAYSKVLRLENRKELPLVTIETTTLNSENQILMKTEDECLMLHEVNHPIYDNSRHHSKLENFAIERVVSKKEVIVYFRWKWDPKVWKNNIHTDDYARKFGFEKGLPEFAVYMDWLYLSQYLQKQKNPNKISIEVSKIKPFYEGDNLEIISLKTEDPHIQEINFVDKKGSLKLQSKIYNYNN